MLSQQRGCGKVWGGSGVCRVWGTRVEGGDGWSRDRDTCERGDTDCAAVMASCRRLTAAVSNAPAFPSYSVCPHFCSLCFNKSFRKDAAAAWRWRRAAGGVRVLLQGVQAPALVVMGGIPATVPALPYVSMCLHICRYIV